MSDNLTTEAWVFIYVRTNEWFEIKNVYKSGITDKLVERNSTYVTGEPESGTFVFVVKVFGNRNEIDYNYKKYFTFMNVYQGGGTEFYHRSILEKIVPYLLSTGQRYEVLSIEEIDSITRVERTNRQVASVESRVEASVAYSVVAPIYNTINSNRKVLEFTDWNPKTHKYITPKLNDKGGKSITIISSQTSRLLHLNTPLLMTWGISDFANDDGRLDGKFKISLNFPNEENKNTEIFLQKMTEFQSQVIDDAVNNSELWFGKRKSKELVEDSFFPFLKYPKQKDANDKSTGTTDYSRPPSMYAKVPCYPQSDSTYKWDCDLFNTHCNQIFPCEDISISPQDLVPKLSKIACTLQCTGIWIGSRGWGINWKFISGIIKPKITESI